MRYTVLIAIPCKQKHKDYFEQTGKDVCRFVFCPELYGNWGRVDETETGQRYYSIIREADIIIGEPPLSLVRQLHDENPGKLKWIQMSWAGTDIYTAQEGFPSKISLTNMRGAFGKIIAEYVVGAIFYFYRSFRKYNENQKKCLWRDCGNEESLEGKRILILGTGDIGTQIAKRLKAFETKIVGYRRKYGDNPGFFDKICGQNDLEREIKKADIIIGCLPNNYGTRNLLGKERLKCMKKEAILINVGRGNLIDTKVLERMVTDKHFLGVALDVTDPEPLPRESCLWHAPQVLITPHIAGPSFGHSEKTSDKIIEICIENLSRYIQGLELLNRIV